MLFIKGLVVFSIYNLYSCNVKLIFTSLMETHFFVFLFYYYLTSSDYFNDLLETVSVSSNGEQINLSAHGVPSSSLSMHDLKFRRRFEENRANEWISNPMLFTDIKYFDLPKGAQIETRIISCIIQNMDNIFFSLILMHSYM